MNSHQVGKSRTALASATAAHVLGWAAFSWLVLSPFSYQGLSATPANLEGNGTLNNRVCAGT